MPALAGASVRPTLADDNPPADCVPADAACLGVAGAFASCLAICAAVTLTGFGTG